MINWEAVAAGAAVGALAVAAIQAISSGLRSTVLYKATSLQSDTTGAGSLYALKLELKNISFRHITDMVLRIDMRKEPIGLGITKTSSVDKKTIKTKFEKDQLIIEIPDMPRLEKIEIDIFSGSYVSSYRPVSGGDKNFVLKSKTNWLWFWGNALTVVAAVGINLMVWGN